MTLADVKPTRQRPGPKPRFSTSEVVETAIGIVDAHGFAALSLRGVARELGITAKALYAYVNDREDLIAMVVNRLVEDSARGIRWPDNWRAVLRTFAAGFKSLLVSHPRMIEAYGSGLVRTGGAHAAAEAVLDRLCADGLPRELALDGYCAVHDLVLGNVLVAAGEGELERCLDLLIAGMEQVSGR